MGFLNKATKMAESYAGGNSCDDNDDLTVREKVIEFAQEKVAEREVEKYQPGYVEKHKSIVEKAVEAAEGYIAKQGESYRDEDEDSSSSSSSDSSSECETKEYASYTKTTRDIPGTDTRVEEEVTVSVRTTTTPEYPSVSTQNYNSSSYRQGDSYGAFNRATLESNDVCSSSEYRSTHIRNETECGTKEYSSYSRTTRDDSEGYCPGNFGDASSSYLTRTTAAPEYSRDVSSYSSVGRQNDDYGALNRMPLEGNSVYSTSEYRSTRIHDEDEYERKEYSSYTRTSRDESDGFGGAMSAYATRVDEEVDYSVRTTASPEYVGNSSREYNSSSYQRTIRQDDNCDAFNRMTLERNDTAYRSTRERDEADYERNEYSSYSRDESSYSTRVDEEVNVSVRTTSTPEYCNNSTPNYSSSSYRSERREDESCGVFNNVSSSSEYRVDGAGREMEEHSSYSRTSRDESTEYRPSPSYSSRVDEQVSYSSRTTSEFSSRPTGGVYGTRELQSYGGNSYGY
ncbi:hypothetical protein PR003_g19510 [Phytophthora rubi]|uniref:Uncharacterized protein n=1 Tax=Phytophthora rubi TaxID=129364 RepID=A0A6A3JQN9_9STRA|nr:hypothetical protein PR002_g19021 [Phytophthora rubi]KAE9001393.1 hypothetical protein PR001_g18532 [Phytophthora rubi]KAE9313396.1 hypothetical protein PR003_g19510 [Phytophthora rubi]